VKQEAALRWEASFLPGQKLKHLRKVELMEMLLAQSRRVEELERQVEALQSQLASRTLQVEQAGDLANACIQVNGVLRAAQAAADQYLENIRLCCDRQKAEAESEAVRILQDAREKADAVMKEKDGGADACKKE
jgi:cell division septum initiation protein DivIVA